jgi:hypothetical protein
MAYFLRRGSATFSSRYNGALHAMRSEPVASYRTSAMVLASGAAARAEDAARALARIPLATAAGYDRSAIMRVALAEAREVRGHGSRKPWRVLIASALRSAWLRAKLARSLAGSAN